ncbi:acyltransferase [Bacteroides ovatus]|nr:acyltransferase [Bacteroides ovatus]
MMLILRLTDLIHKTTRKAIDILRYCYFKVQMGHIGKGSYIKPGVRITGNPKRIFIGKKFKIWHNSVISVGKGKILFGDDGLIGVGSFVSAGNSQIIIGNGVAIAPHCNIIAYSHHYKENEAYVNCYKEGDIIIGNNVLIGAAVIILPNVNIGNNSVIAAGCVVNKDVPDNTMVGGIPMRVIRTIK